MKTDMTKQIEKALGTYAPKRLGGVEVNYARGTHFALEVVAQCGHIEGGIVDAVQVNEVFRHERAYHMCYWHRYPEAKIPPIPCKRGICPPEKYPKECDEAECRDWWPAKEKSEDMMVTCYEIKVTKADFKSTHGHNFVGNCNYYVVPTEIYKDIIDLVPEDIGVITLAGESLTRRKDCVYRELTREQMAWLMLSVMKKRRKDEIKRDSQRGREEDARRRRDDPFYRYMWTDREKSEECAAL